MLFNYLLFLLPTIAGLILAIAGIVLLKYPPKKINWIYGYRTSSSMKNGKRWDFAQIYSAKEMIKLGGLSMLSGLIGLVINPNVIIALGISMGLLIFLVIILIIKTETAIKNKFPEE